MRQDVGRAGLIALLEIKAFGILDYVPSLPGLKSPIRLLRGWSKSP